MGSKLVDRLQDSSNLIPRDVQLARNARIVFTRMCAMAKDDDAPPVYFGGWAPLATALGYSLALEDAQDPTLLERKKTTAQRRVRATLRALKDLGLIVPATTNRPTGRRQHFALILDQHPAYTWLPVGFRNGRYIWERVGRPDLDSVNDGEDAWYHPYSASEEQGRGDA